MPGFTDNHSERSWLIRVGPKCNKYGDPYTWCCNVKDEGDGRGLVYGVVASPTKQEILWTMEVATELGFSKLRWSRIKNGSERLTEYFKIKVVL